MKNNMENVHTDGLGGKVSMIIIFVYVVLAYSVTIVLNKFQHIDIVVCYSLSLSLQCDVMMFLCFVKFFHR